MKIKIKPGHKTDLKTSISVFFLTFYFSLKILDFLVLLNLPDDENSFWPFWLQPRPGSAQEFEICFRRMSLLKNAIEHWYSHYPDNLYYTDPSKLTPQFLYDNYFLRKIPVCPAGGKYSFININRHFNCEKSPGIVPACSIHGNKSYGIPPSPEATKNKWPWKIPEISGRNIWLYTMHFLTAAFIAFLFTALVSLVIPYIPKLSARTSIKKPGKKK